MKRRSNPSYEAELVDQIMEWIGLEVPQKHVKAVLWALMMVNEPELFRLALKELQSDYNEGMRE